MDIPLIFEQTDFAVHVPEVPGSLNVPEAAEERAQWIRSLLDRTGERETCFYDEKLVYVCELSYRAGLDSRTNWQSALEHITRNVKLTTTCSFIPSQPVHRPATTFNDRRRSVLPLQPNHNFNQSQGAGSSLSATSSDHLAFPPTTPNPQPGVQQRYAQYANTDGVLVWEGPVGLSSSCPGPIIIKDPEGKTYKAYFVAEIPLSFANVDMLHPLLALTCQATIRERDGFETTIRANRGLGIVAASTDEDSEVQEVAIKVHAPDYEDDLSKEIVTIEKAQERDMFRGLAGPAGGLPFSRLNPSKTQERTYAKTSVSSRSNKTSTTVLKKSFRAILPILSVLTVRMRTLPIAVLPPSSSSSGSALNGPGSEFMMEGDLAATICIEVEAGQLEARGETFEVEQVKVVAGRQGSDPTAIGADATVRPRVTLALPPKPPKSGAEGDSARQDHFPFDVRLHDQHNLIYNVSASSMPNGVPSNGLPSEGGEIGGSWGSRSESVPLRIDVIGRVKQTKDGVVTYINASFTSTWNTVIELKTPEKKNRLSTFRSISSSLNARPNSIGSVPGRTSSLRQIPMSGKTQAPTPLPFHRDLVVTANIIGSGDDNGVDPRNGSEGNGDPSTGGSRRGNEVACYEVFYLEVTVLNASGRTVRLMLSSGETASLRGVEEEKGVRRLISPSATTRSSSIPAPGPVIFLEDDVLLPPLLPRSCQATRIRCMALEEGIHPLPMLQLLDNERDLVADLRFDMYIRSTL